MVLERLERFRLFFFFFPLHFGFFLALFYIPFFYIVTLSLIHCAIFSLSTSSHPPHSPSPPPQPLNHPQPTPPPLTIRLLSLLFPAPSPYPNSPYTGCARLSLALWGGGLGATRGVDVSNVLNVFMHFRGKKLFYQKCVRFYRFALSIFFFI